ncbi:MAG: hypothetical protein GY804_09890 [Alphaproteobacteria bacterium]|nr:hypothetical protein [Alphaproteobacteria bacterium]
MRTTDKQLNDLIDRINELENRPLESYSKKNGKYTANIGNLHLESRASLYGAYTKSVWVMETEGGGVGYFFREQDYYKPAELLAKLQGYISGLERAKK